MLTLPLKVYQWTIIQFWVAVLCGKRHAPLFQFTVGPFHLCKALFNVSGGADNPHVGVFIKSVVVSEVVLGLLCGLDQELGLDFLHPAPWILGHDLEVIHVGAHAIIAATVCVLLQPDITVIL